MPEERKTWVEIVAEEQASGEADHWKILLVIAARLDQLESVRPTVPAQEN